MVPVVVAVLDSLWLVVRARRPDAARDDRRRGAWPLALTCLALSVWFAVHYVAPADRPAARAAGGHGVRAESVPTDAGSSDGPGGGRSDEITRGGC